MKKYKSSSLAIGNDKEYLPSSTPMAKGTQFSEYLTSPKSTKSFFQALENSQLEIQPLNQSTLQQAIASSNELKRRRDIKKTMLHHYLPCIGRTTTGFQSGQKQLPQETRFFQFDQFQKNENKQGSKVTEQHTMIYKQKVLKQNLATKMKLAQSRVIQSSVYTQEVTISRLNKAQADLSNSLLIYGQGNLQLTQKQDNMTQSNNSLNITNINNNSLLLKNTLTPLSMSRRSFQNSQQTQHSYLNTSNFKLSSNENSNKFLQLQQNQTSYMISSFNSSKSKLLEVRGANGAQLQQQQQQQQLEQQQLQQQKQLVMKQQEQKRSLKQEVDQANQNIKGKKAVTFNIDISQNGNSRDLPQQQPHSMTQNQQLKDSFDMNNEEYYDILDWKLEGDRNIQEKQLKTINRRRVEGVLIQPHYEMKKVLINKGKQSLNINIYSEDTCNGKYKWKIREAYLGTTPSKKEFQVFCSKTQKDYSIKIIEFNDNFEGEECLEAICEILILDRMKELNGILQLVDAFVLQQHQYKKLVIVNEYYQSSLSDILLFRKQHQLRWVEQEAMMIFKQILDANETIQQNNVCHRNLKPSNILFSSHDNAFKLSEFSEAKFIEKVNEGSQHCLNKQKQQDATGDEDIEEHSFRGTLKYLSPELSLEHKKKNEICFYNPFLSDLFSLGVMFTELLSLEEIPENENFTHKQYLNNLKNVCTCQISQQYPHASELILSLLSEIPSQRKSYKKILTRYEMQNDLIHLKLQAEREVAMKIEKQRESQVVNQATKLFLIAQGYEGMCMLDQAVEVYNQALQALQASYSSTIISEALYYRARCYQKKNQYHQSYDYFKQCYEFRNQNYSPYSREIGQILSSLGVQSYKLGKYAESMQLFEQSLSIASKQYGEDNILVANMKNNLALAYCKLKQDQKGGEQFKQSIDIFSRINQKRKVQEVLINLAILHLNAGDLVKSEECLVRALSQAKEQYGENSSELINIYINLGQLYQEYNKYYENTKPFPLLESRDSQTSRSGNERQKNNQKSIEYLLLAEKLIFQNYGQSYLQLGQIYLLLGMVFNTVNDSVQMFHYYHKSEQVFQDSNDEVSLLKISSYLAAFHTSKGDFEKAESYYLKELEASMKINKDDELQQADIIFNIGSTCLHQNKKEDAVDWFLKAQSLYKNNIEDHENIAIIEKILLSRSDKINN